MSKSTTLSTAPLLPPSARATPGKRRVPTWLWIIIVFLVALVGVILSPVFAALSLIVLITGVVAIARGTRTWLRFPTRKAAIWVTATAAVMLLLTGSVANAVLSSRQSSDPVAFLDGKSSAPAASPTGGSAPTTTPTPTPTPTAWSTKVLNVLDGDTVETDAGKVGLIGIDAPEQGFWGYDQAAAELSAFLATGAVTLVAVEGRDDVDQDGQLLRYVRIGASDAGTHMIDSGWAIARYDDRDGYGAHPLQSDYIDLDAAREMPAEPKPEPAPAPPAPVTPPAPAAPATDPQFRTCGDANDAGYGDYHAGVDSEYDWYQDRDHDGWVCER